MLNKNPVNLGNCRKIEAKNREHDQEGKIKERTTRAGHRRKYIKQLGPASG